MIQLLVAVVLLTDVAFCDDEPRVSITNATLGNDCQFPGSEYRCEVKRGTAANFTATFDINGGGGHLAIKNLYMTIKWSGLGKGKKPIIVGKKVAVCAVTGGILTMNGGCGTLIIVEGTYPLIPYTIQVPDHIDPGVVNLDFYASAKWDAAGSNQRYEVASLQVNLL